MDLVTLRLTTYSKTGSEVTHSWTFEALRDKRSFRQARETGVAGTGRLRRRPFTEREVRTITLPAGLLLDDDQFACFKRLIRAHKIEWHRYVGGKLVWVEYDLDLEESVEPELHEDLDRLERYTFKLVQSDAQWFTDFENKEAELAR